MPNDENDLLTILRKNEAPATGTTVGGTDISPGIAPEPDKGSNDLLDILRGNQRQPTIAPVDRTAPIPEFKPLQSLDSIRSDELQANLLDAISANPQEELARRRIAKILDIEPAAVPPNGELSAFLQENDPERLVRDHPGLAKFLSNASNAAVVGKDVPFLRDMNQTLRRITADPVIALAKGATAIPQTVLGLSEITNSILMPWVNLIFPEQQRAEVQKAVGDKLPEWAADAMFKQNPGRGLKAAQDELSNLYSPAQKAATQSVQQANGFVDTFVAALESPSSIAQMTLESVGPMLMGGAAARGVLQNAGKEVSAIWASAVGEGSVIAGGTAAKISEDQKWKPLTQGQAALSLGAGGLGGAIGFVGGKVLQRMGVEDIDVAIARGTLQKAADSSGMPASLASKVLLSGVGEGLLQEMPQSAVEQIAQNLATGRPWDEEVPESMALGLLSGASMGAGGTAIQGVSEAAFGAKPESLSKPMSDGINDALTRSIRAHQATNHRDTLAAIGKQAATDPLRAKSKEAFSEFIRTMADEEPDMLKEVYVAPDVLENALNQSGVSKEELEKTMPELARELKEATFLGSDVRVSTEDYLTHIAGTNAEPLILDNLRTAPDGMTYAEAQVYTQEQTKILSDLTNDLVKSNTPVLNRQDFEAQQPGASYTDYLKNHDNKLEAFQQDANDVHDTILSGLNGAKRFNKAVNSVYAVPFREFFTTNAARLGILPSELYARYPLNFSKLNVGDMLDQPAMPVDATPEDFRPENLDSILSKSGWVIFTSDNPNAQPVSKEENDAAREVLRKDLDTRGLVYEEVMGRYPGDPEEVPSFLVFGVNPELATQLARDYGQDSVLTREGFVYRDGSITKATTVRRFSNADEGWANGGYTRLPGTDSIFQVDFDWTGKSYRGVHYGHQQFPTLSGYFAGRGLPGADNERVRNALDSRIRRYVDFYTDVGAGVTKESGLGDIRHEVTLNNIYDADANPDGFDKGTTPEGLNNFESQVLDAGYAGYYSLPEGDTTGRIRVLGDAAKNIDVETIDGRNVTGEARVLSRQAREDTIAREADGSLKNLPRKIGDFQASHWAPAEEVARKYMSDAGLPYDRPNTYVKVDKKRAERIAKAFTWMRHTPNNPQVKAAYDALVAETIAQYKAVIDSGLVVEFITGDDPYAGNPRAMTEDVRNNNHMWVFSTRDGFGSDADFNPAENPLLTETEFEISGQKALVNDLFRVVHDYFGHVKEGVGFRADGEENAWRAHMSMFSPLAGRALTTETRGQNSWVNFGPFGEQNRTASAADTHYADQKVGLLPEWVSIEGATDEIPAGFTPPPVLFQFAGTGAVTANLDLLSTAQERIRAGANAEAVRMLTGWFQGPDKKWRFEIDDSDAKLLSTDFTKDVPLFRVLDHSALFSAYPSLRHVIVRTGTGGAYGSFTPSAAPVIEIGENTPLDMILSTLLHEVQHGVQNIEGFAEGSNVAFIEQNLLNFIPESRLKALEDSATYRALTNDKDRAQLIDIFAKRELGSAYGVYRRIAGEVEARNVQTRQLLSKTERELMPPWATQDIAPEDVIVTFNGVIAENAPPPANIARPVIAPSRKTTALLMSGRETLRKYGLNPKKSYTTRQVAAALEARQREKFGSIARGDKSPEALDDIAKWMAEEVAFEMANPQDSGVGWYSERFQRALDVMGERFPELKTDKNARGIFTALLAITSDGQKVVPNLAMAAEIYDGYSRTGKLKLWKRSHMRGSFGENVGVLSDIVAKLGREKALEYLLSEETLDNLRKLAAEHGETLTSSYEKDTKLPMAALAFGPKLGAFFANLMGSHGYLTMDRWWSRTFNRYRGTLITAPTKAGLDNFRQLLGRPELSDDETVAATVAYHDAYANRKPPGKKRGAFNTRLKLLVGRAEPRNDVDKAAWHAEAREKAGADYEELLAEHNLERAANTIYTAAFESLEDAPFNASDRTFMIEATVKAQKILKRRGVNISIADIQAVLWYYEKKLYGRLGAIQSGVVSYEDAARRYVSGQTTAADIEGGAGEEADELDAGEVSIGTEIYGQGTTEGVDTLSQSAFYSALERNIGGLSKLANKLGSVKTAQAKAWIDARQKEGKFKKEEVEAVGLIDWLDLQGDTVGVTEVQDFVRANGVQVQDVMHEGTGEDTSDVDEGERIDAITEEVLDTVEVSRYNEDGEPDEWTVRYNGTVYTSAVDPWDLNTTDFLNLIEYEAPPRVLPPPAVNFERWTEPGGTDYKELALVMPGDALHKAPGAHRMSEAADINRLAHVRFKTRTGDTGNVLFLEELQSDWAQEGRKEGFQVKLTPGEKELQELNAITFRRELTPGERQRHGELVEAGHRESLVSKLDGTKSAPFVTDTKAWVALSLKRMLRYAVENGFDRVSWTTGEQQVNRYGLSKLVRMTYGFRSGGNVWVHATEKDTDRTVFEREVPASELPSIVGVDVADKMLRREGRAEPSPHMKPIRERGKPTGVFERDGDWYIQFPSAEMGTYPSKESAERGAAQITGMVEQEDNRVLEGDDLKVGGEGMRSFYDQIVPQVANDILKRLKGGKVNVQTVGGLGEQMGFDITPELREAVMQGLPLFQEQRASYNPANFTIALLNGSDLSSVIHEGAHFYLETLADMAAQPDAPSDIKEDFKKTLRWFGVLEADWATMTLDEKRPFHEQWAQSFERYALEGKAPTVEMQPVFARFRSWMLGVYKSLKEFLKQNPLAGKLNDDIRGVFDRLLAAQDAIEESEKLREYMPLFGSPEEAGISLQEYEDYKGLGEEATQSAVADMGSRSLRDMRWASRARDRMIRALQREARSKRKAIAAQVSVEVRTEPVNRARAFFGRDVNVDDLGVESKIGTETKLNRDAVKSLVSSADLRMFRGMLADDGIHPDTAGNLFGYRSGAELVQAIAKEPLAKDKIDAVTDQRMLEEHGDLVDDAAVSRAADEAIHNEARAKFMATGLKILQKSPVKVTLINKAAKQAAESAIAARKIRELSPSVYARAEAKASKEAVALAPRDPEGAIREQRKALLNNRLVKASQEAIREVERTLKYLKKFQNAGTRKALSVDYLEQIDDLLHTFNFKNQSLRQIDKNKSLNDWVQDQIANGFEPAIDVDRVENVKRKAYKDMTVEELRGLRDAVKQIEHLARLKKKLLTALDNREFQARIEEAQQSIYDNARGKTAKERATPTDVIGKTAKFFRWMAAVHRKFSSIVRQFDGGKDGGVLWELLVRPMNTAGDFKTELNKEAADKIAAIFKALPKEGTVAGNLYTRRKLVPGTGLSLSQEERLMMALNWGNEGNRQRLLDGGIAGRKGLTRAEVDKVLDTLTKQEWDFVQGVFDLVGSYKGQIATLERALTGVEPEWVEPTPIDTKFGTIKGGYFPAKYDTDLATRSADLEAASDLRMAMKGAFQAAGTRHGYTQKRSAEVKDRPLLLSYSTIAQHIDEVTHRLAWQPWVTDANRILKALDGTIREHYGPELLKELRDTVLDVASGDTQARGPLDIAANHLRTGSTIVGMAWRFSTAAIQVSGLSQSWARIGGKWVAKGIAQYAKSPNASVKFVDEKSSFMKNRAITMQREINDILNVVRSGEGMSNLKASYFVMIYKMQRVVDLPTWLGSYEKALEESGYQMASTAQQRADMEARAVALADQAVIDSQSGGMAKDLAKVQRGSPIGKLFTNFYSYFSATYNLNVEAVRKTNFKSPTEVGLLAVDLVLLNVVPVLFSVAFKQATRGGCDEGDTECLATEYAKEQVGFLMSQMILLREAGAATSALIDEKSVFGYQGPAGLRFFSDLYKTGTQIRQGEVDWPLIKWSLSTTGTLLHLPVGQVNATVEGIMAIENGDVEGIQILPALLFGAPKD